MDNLKAVLWDSTSKLMLSRYGKENLTRLARECKFGAATAARLKGRDTEVRLDTIQALAKRFGFQAWQLLVPGFDPENPPKLEGGDLPSDIKELLDLYKRLDRDTQPALLNRARSLQEAASASKSPAKRRA